MAKFHHFGNFTKVYLVFGKIVNLLWQLFYTNGQIFIVVKGLMLTEYFSILLTLDASHTKRELQEHAEIKARKVK